MSAPIGNQNAAKQKRLFNSALKRLLVQAPERLDGLAAKLVSLAEAGEGWAFKELIDRLDGKAPQPIVGGDDEDNPVKIVGRIELTDLVGNSTSKTTEEA